MPTEAEDRFFCIGCRVQVVVCSEAQVESPAVRFQREEHLCSRCIVKREKGTKQSEKHFMNPVERGEIGPDLFSAACRMGLKDWSQSTATDPIAPGTEPIMLLIE